MENLVCGRCQTVLIDDLEQEDRLQVRILPYEKELYLKIECLCPTCENTPYKIIRLHEFIDIYKKE